MSEVLKRIYKNKDELLLVLARPEVPLHTNDSERDIRDYVKKRKISDGTQIIPYLPDLAREKITAHYGPPAPGY